MIRFQIPLSDAIEHKEPGEQLRAFAQYHGQHYNNRNCRWQCRQLTTCSTNKSLKCRSAKRTCPTFLSRRNSYSIPILT